MALRDLDYPAAYRIAHAAGWDAGDRRMAAEGRDAWNAEDWDHAAAIFHRVILALLKAAPERDAIRSMNNPPPREAPLRQRKRLRVFQRNRATRSRGAGAGG